VSEQQRRAHDSTLMKISENLDDIRLYVSEIKTNVALNHQAYNNLNAELQEYKSDNKWRTTRNIAIVTIMFTALGCWIGLKGLKTQKQIVVPTAITKEISSNDKNFDDNRKHGRVEG